jgi:hypothetical protein
MHEELALVSREAGRLRPAAEQRDEIKRRHFKIFFVDVIFTIH